MVVPKMQGGVGMTDNQGAAEIQYRLCRLFLRHLKNENKKNCCLQCGEPLIQIPHKREKILF